MTTSLVGLTREACRAAHQSVTLRAIKIGAQIIRSLKDGDATFMIAPTTIAATAAGGRRR